VRRGSARVLAMQLEFPRRMLLASVCDIQLGNLNSAHANKRLASVFNSLSFDVVS